MSQGTHYSTIAELFAVGISNVSKCIHDVAHQILIHMYHEYIRLPTLAEGTRSMRAWERQTGIPGIMGAIDGTHIEVIKPVDHGEVYFNRKGYYSLNIQGICHVYGRY